MTKKEKAFNYFKSQKNVSVLEMSIFIPTTAAPSMIADLRKLGCRILKKFLYTNDDNVKIYEYTMTSYPDNIKF